MLIREPPQTTRYFWIWVRGRDWWQRAVPREFSDEEWRETFKMSHRSSKKKKKKLCSVMKGTWRPRDETVCALVALEMK